MLYLVLLIFMGTMNDKNKTTTSTVRVLKLGDAHRQAEQHAPGSLTLDALQGFIASVSSLENQSRASESQPAGALESDQPAARVSSLDALGRTGLSLTTTSGGDKAAVPGHAQLQVFPGGARPKPRKD